MDYNYTMAINQGEPKPQPKDRKETPPQDRTPPEKTEAAPVLGWLVCVGGRTDGLDIPLMKQITHLAGNMDISPEPLGCSDKDAHLVITYDKDANTFSIRRENECRVSLNGSPLPGRELKMKAYDEIQLPGLLLCFIPFCEGDRKWR